MYSWNCRFYIFITKKYILYIKEAKKTEFSSRFIIKKYQTKILTVLHKAKKVRNEEKGLKSNLLKRKKIVYTNILKKKKIPYRSSIPPPQN